MKKQFLNKANLGITLVALIITIIILLILAGVSIALLNGDDGLITKARWSSFLSEMSSVSEQVNLAATNKAMEIYKNGDEMSEDFQATLFQRVYDSSKMSDTLKNEVLTLTGSANSTLYYVDLDNVKKDTYLYEPTIKVVFKISGINIRETTIHSVEFYNSKNENSDISSKVADMEPEYTNGYYEPNLNGFDSLNTYIVYYSEDYSESYQEITVEEYISSGRPKTITKEGKAYTFYNYSDTENSSTWGNIKTFANGQEAWWVWIPRYAYDNSTISTSNGFDIKFINLNNEILDADGKILGTVGDSNYSNYISHSGFTEKYTDTNNEVQTVKELTGLWMSKYEPSTTTSFENSQVTQCYGPNLIGYDINNTYIATYNKEGTELKNQYLLKDMLRNGYSTSDAGSLISGQIDLSKISNDEVWYDYGNQIWGNIVTKANDQEAWWVWIPRYAYSIDGSNTGFGVMFVDLNDKTFGNEINDSLNQFQIHPGFNLADGTKLKGIWMSKYEPSGDPSSNDLISPTISE